MTTDHTTLTDEQIDAFIARVDAWRVRWNTYSGPEYDDLRRACNDVVELVVAFRNERAAHQRTRNAVHDALMQARLGSLDGVLFRLSHYEQEDA